MADKETSFGITEYFDINSEGFDGSVKSRISDFLVNEVDLSGNILHFTQIDLPAEMIQPDSLLGTLDEDIRLKIQTFVRSCDRILEIPAPEDKDARRVLHQQIQACFPNDKLLRNPLEKPDGSRVIEISRGSSGSPAFRRQQATRSRQSTCDFIHFLLYKENVDTMEAVNTIGDCMHVPPRCIQYAGVKDKRAKTVQKISLRFRDPRRLTRFSHPGMRIGNFSFEKEALQLGDLGGNHFQLAIREISATKEIVQKAAAAFVDGCFINFYGLQRFGTTEISTPAVGITLLKSDWDSAVDLIMKPRGADNQSTAECRRIWLETKDPEKALRALGNRTCVESHLLKGLIKSHDNNKFGAVQNISRNMRLMYVHSYQSYLWNLGAAYRIKTLGRRPVVGDLVFKASEEPRAKRQKRGAEADAEVISLTEDNLKDYSIFDVLFPLPGYNIKFPDNPVTTYLLDLMEADGIDLRVRHNVKDYSLSGSYRHLVVKPKNTTWEVKSFDDPVQDLQLSDADILDNRSLPATSELGKHTALLIQFTLPSSVYATMAIRELMKRSSDYEVKYDLASGNNPILSGEGEDLTDGDNVEEKVVEESDN